jgi:hypothetical protein
VAQSQEEMKDWILLDSQSLVDLFCNPALVQDVANADETLFATNAGDLSTKTKGTVPEYGKVWFYDKVITNFFSLASMEDTYCVTYDSAQESAFIIHMPKGTVQVT